MDFRKRIKEAQPPLCHVRLILAVGGGEIALDTVGPDGARWIALHPDDTIESVLRALAVTQAAGAAAFVTALDTVLKAKRANDG